MNGLACTEMHCHSEDIAIIETSCEFSQRPHLNFIRDAQLLQSRLERELQVVRQRG